MGIKQFSKTFEPVNKFNRGSLKNVKLAVDALTEIHRCILAMEHLTDSEGNVTSHIKILLGELIKFKKNNVKTIWIFDYKHNEEDTEFHNPMKINELNKRRLKKEEAKKEIQDLQQQLIDNRTNKLDIIEFINEEIPIINEDVIPEKRKFLNEEVIIKKLDTLKKVAFQMKEQYIKDVMFLLDSLGVPWIYACKGYEGEHIASFLCKNGIVDAVLSCDTDPIAYGSPVLYRVLKSEVFVYNRDNLIEQVEKIKGEEIKFNDLLKIFVILGTDACEKTPRIGPKTVIKKYDDVELNESQLKAIEEFKKPLLDKDYRNKLKEIRNIFNNEQKIEKEKIDKLIVWLKGKQFKTELYSDKLYSLVKV